jgi:hypothetical protein
MTTTALGYSAPFLLQTSSSTYDNLNVAGPLGSIAFSFNATVGGTATGAVLLIAGGKTTADFGTTTIKFYDGFPATPNGTALSGSLAYSSFTNSTLAGLILLSFTGSVTIATPGTYWGKFADVPSGKNIWVRYGNPRSEAFTYPWIVNPAWMCESNACTSTNPINWFVNVNITRAVS